MTLAFIYAVLLIVLWRFQEHIVFQPPGVVPSAEVLARRVEYRADDGVDLFAYIVGDCSPGRPLVVAFHGNADLARWFVPWASHVAREADACVMIPEYRGYDGAGGVPSYEGSRNDARAALQYVRQSLRPAPQHTVYFGHSLGTAIAAELAAVDPPSALVLQSPFSSARAMSRRLFVPWLTAFWGLISRVHFDTIARVGALDVPVWVTHGDRDAVIPVGMGREVFAAARRKGELLIVPGANHNDVSEIGGRAYWSWLVRAIRSGDNATVTSGARARIRLAP